GIAADRAQAVLTAMCSLGLLTREEQDYRNTPTGAVLTGEGAADGLDLSSPALLDLFSLVELIDVLKGGFAARTSRASTAEAHARARRPGRRRRRRGGRRPDATSPGFGADDPHPGSAGPGRRRGLAERRLHARDRRTDRTLPRRYRFAAGSHARRESDPGHRR